MLNEKTDEYIRRIEQSGFNMSPMFRIMIKNYLEDLSKVSLTMTRLCFRWDRKFQRFQYLLRYRLSCRHWRAAVVLYMISLKAHSAM